MMHKVDFKN